MRLTTLISAGIFIVASAFIMKKEHIDDTMINQPLYDTKWSLKKIHTETGIQDVQTKAFIKFNEEKKSAGGNGSCNTFGSSSSVSNNQVSFKNIFSTKMYCEDVQQIENIFLNQLGKVNRFEIKNKTLFLYNDKDLLLEFEAE